MALSNRILGTICLSHLVCSSSVGVDKRASRIWVESVGVCSFRLRRRRTRSWYAHSCSAGVRSGLMYTDLLMISSADLRSSGAHLRSSAAAASLDDTINSGWIFPGYCFPMRRHLVLSMHGLTGKFTSHREVNNCCAV